MSEITAALLGLTHPHSPFHLRSLQLSSRVDRIVLWDPDKQAAEALASGEESKISASYTDLADILRLEPIQLAIVTVRNDLNPSVCITALEAGVHVISEKPIATNAADIKRVMNTAARAGRKLGVCYMNRFQPAVQRARQLVREGILGRITSCEARLITSQIKFRDPSLWLFDREKAGGGILNWLGCHHLDLMRYITGEEVTTVSAVTATLSDESIDVEDVASVSLRFHNGAVGSLQAGYQLPISDPGYSEATYDSYFAFRGTEGHLFWNPTEHPMTLHVQSSTRAWRAEPTRRFQFDLPDCEAYGGTAGLDFLNAFIAATSDEGEPPASGDDALQVAQIVEAAYQSSETGRHVDLAT